MERTCSSIIALCTLALILVVPVAPVSGQVTTACTSTLLNSFAPCFNFLAGNGSGSPTAACCKSLAQLIGSSTRCVCLIVTGNVPANLPINRTLALSLPQLCNSQPLPLQCSAPSAPVPSAGAPSAFSPSLPPLPPVAAAPPTPSTTLSPSGPTSASTPQPVTENSPVGQGVDGQAGQRPVVLPSSAAELSHRLLSGISLLLVLGTSLMLV